MFFHRDCNCKKDLEDLKTKVFSFELELEKLKSHIISLRGLVNRKIESPGIKEFEDPKTETDNNIKPSIFLSPNGLPI